MHRNDHHIETMCRAQHLGQYLEGQGHSMTLQQNRVRPIISLFVVRFWNNFTEMITILRRRVTCKILAATLKVKVTAWPFSKIVFGPYLCYLKSDFTIILYNWSSYWQDVSRATFGSLFEGQGHIMSFQHNCVRPITSLFEVLFKNYFI